MAASSNYSLTNAPLFKRRRCPQVPGGTWMWQRDKSSLDLPLIQHFAVHDEQPAILCLPQAACNRANKRLASKHRGRMVQICLLQQLPACSYTP